MKKTSLFLLVLIMVLASFAGCQTAPEAEAPVVAEAPAEEVTEAPTAEPTEEPAPEVRIISTVPSVTEILFALGSGDDVVGVDAFSTYPEEAMTKEQVGDYSGFDIEKVISLEPTVVFAGTTLQQEQIDTLVDLGVNVLPVEPTSFDDIIPSILEIGAAVGKAEEAKVLTDDMSAAIEAVANNASIPAERPTIYYVISYDDYGNWTSGEGSFINKAMQIAGGECVTNGPDMAAWMDYPLEDLLLDDPDILVLSQWVSEETLLADPVYSELTAIKEGNYFFINPDLIERPGPRIIDGLELIQAYIMGE